VLSSLFIAFVKEQLTKTIFTKLLLAFLLFSNFVVSIWQFILRGRDFILIFNIKDIIKKGVPEKKSPPLKITCHFYVDVFSFFSYFVISYSTVIIYLK